MKRKWLSNKNDFNKKSKWLSNNDSNKKRKWLSNKKYLPIRRGNGCPIKRIPIRRGNCCPIRRIPIRRGNGCPIRRFHNEEEMVVQPAIGV
jgi:hypothetical protein